MQTSLAITVVTALLLLPAAAPAQTKSPSSTKASPVTLSGCVSANPLGNGDFTFVDDTTGSKFRLTGKGLRKYAGQQVEIVSGASKGLTVKGGLYPSPNIAAQAGAIDPAQEAIARQPGGAATGIGGVELPEFRVARVRALPGACQ